MVCVGFKGKLAAFLGENIPFEQDSLSFFNFLLKRRNLSKRTLKLEKLSFQLEMYPKMGEAFSPEHLSSQSSAFYWPNDSENSLQGERKQDGQIQKNRKTKQAQNLMGNGHSLQNNNERRRSVELEQKIVILMEQNNSVLKERDSLLVDLEEAKAKNKELKLKILQVKSLEEENRKMRKELDEIMWKSASQARKPEETEEKLKDQVKEARLLQKESEQREILLKEENKRLSQRINSLSANQVHLPKLIIRAKGQGAHEVPFDKEVQEIILRLENEIKTLKDKMNDQTDLFHQKENMISELESKVSSLVNQNSLLQSETSMRFQSNPLSGRQNMSEQSEFGKQIVELERKLQEALNEISRLEKNGNISPTMRKQMHGNERKLAQISIENQRLQNIIKELNEKINESNKRRIDSSKEFIRLEETLRSTKAEAESKRSLERDLGRKQDEILSLNNKVSMLQSQLSMVELQKNQAEEKTQRLSLEKANLQSELAEMEFKFKTISSEKEQLSSNLANAQLETEKKTYEREKTSHLIKDTRIGELEAKIASLVGQNERNLETISQLQEEASKKQESLWAFERKCQEAEEKLTNEKAENHKNQLVLTQIRSSLEASQQENSRLVGMNELLKTQMAKMEKNKEKEERKEKNEEEIARVIERGSLERQISSLEHENRQLKTKNEFLRKEVFEKESKIRLFQVSSGQNEDNQKKVVDLQSRIRDLENELVSSKAQKEGLMVEKTQREIENQMDKISLSSLNSKVKELQEQLDSREKNEQELTDKLESKETKTGRSSSGLGMNLDSYLQSQSSSQIIELNVRIAELEKRSIELLYDRETTQRKLSEKEKEASELKRAIELKTMGMSSYDLKPNQPVLSSFRTGMTELDSIFSESAAIDQLKRKLASKERELSLVEDSLKNSIERLNDLQEKLSKLAMENQRLLKHNEELQGDLNDKEISNMRERTAMAILKNKNSDLTRKLEEIQKEMERVKEDLAKMEKGKRNLQEKNEEIEEQMKKAKEALHETSKESREARELKSGDLNLKGKLEKMKEEIQDLQEEKENLENVVNELQKRMRQLEKEADFLRSSRPFEGIKEPEMSRISDVSEFNHQVANIEELQEKVMQKEKEIKLLEIKMNEYERRLMGFPREADGLRRELERKEARNIELTTKQKHLQESIKVLSEDRDKVVCRLKEEIKRLEEENLRLAEELNEFQSKRFLNERQGGLKPKINEDGPLRKALHESEEERQRLSSLLKQLKEEYERLLKSGSHDLELHIRRNKDQVYEELKERCGMVVVENERLQNRIQRMKREHEEVMQQNERKKSRRREREEGKKQSDSEYREERSKSSENESQSRSPSNSKSKNKEKEIQRGTNPEKRKRIFEEEYHKIDKESPFVVRNGMSLISDSGKFLKNYTETSEYSRGSSDYGERAREHPRSSTGNDSRLYKNDERRTNLRSQNPKTTNNESIGLSGEFSLTSNASSKGIHESSFITFDQQKMRNDSKTVKKPKK